MAELADAYGSGPYECKFMQVQVLLSAPRIPNRTLQVWFGIFIIQDLNLKKALKLNKTV